MSGFTVINNSILNDKNLIMQEKFLLIILKSFDHKRDGIVYPSYEKLMELSGIGRRNNISNIIKSLQEKGYIIIGKKGRVNKYKFVKDYLLSDTTNINIDTNKDYNNNEISTYDDTNEKGVNNRVTYKKETSTYSDTISSNQLATDTVTSNQRDTRSSSQLATDTVTSNQRDTRNSNQLDTSNNNTVDTYVSNHVDTLKIKEKNTKEKYNIYSDLNNNYIFNKSMVSINSC